MADLKLTPAEQNIVKYHHNSIEIFSRICFCITPIAERLLEKKRGWLLAKNFLLKEASHFGSRYKASNMGLSPLTGKCK